MTEYQRIKLPNTLFHDKCEDRKNLHQHFFISFFHCWTKPIIESVLALNAGFTTHECEKCNIMCWSGLCSLTISFHFDICWSDLSERTRTGVSCLKPHFFFFTNVRFSVELFNNPETSVPTPPLPFPFDWQRRTRVVAPWGDPAGSSPASISPVVTLLEQ